MNRIDRVTAILIQLQSKRVVKAQDIAERFGISLRTVYRDVRTLEEAGIPIVGEAGVGYSIMDGYRLPPVMFTMEEATAFLTAEKLIEKMTDASTEESYKSAMYKIKAVLRSTEKDLLEHIDNHIEVIKSACMPELKQAVSPLQTILQCIATKAVLQLHYFAGHSQEHTQRQVEPIGVFYQAGRWHLIGFCRLRKDYRDFRLDRISQIAATDEIHINKHPSLKAYIKDMVKEKELQAVVIKVNKSIAKHLGDQKFYNGFVSEREIKDCLEMTFLTTSTKGFLRWFMMFADEAEIVSPDAMKQEYRDLVLRLSQSFSPVYEKLMA